MHNLEVKTSDGKYTVIQDESGAISILRYKENWMGPAGFPGNGAVLALAQDIHELREELRTAVNYLRQGKIKYAPHTTNSLVDDFIAKHSGEDSNAPKEK